MSVKIFTGLGIVPNFSIAQVGSKLVSVEALSKTDLTQVRTATGTPFTEIASKQISTKIRELEKFESSQASRVESEKSISGPYSTIFDKFRFKAEATYNFFVEDEETNDKEVYDGRPLDDVARYITLTWDIAPEKKDLKKGQFSDKTSKPGTWSGPLIIDRNGIVFDPLLTKASAIKDLLANGFLSPGTIRANVSMGSTTSVDNVQKNIDEDMFLSSEQDVYSINELKSNIRAVTETAPFDASSGLVSGKFMMQKSLMEESLSVRSGQPSSPSITMMAKTVLSNAFNKTSIDQLKSITNIVSQPSITTLNKINTKVNFVEPNIANVVSLAKVDGATKPEHAESIIGIGTMLPAFEKIIPMMPILPKVNPPVIPAPEELNGIEYIGYVIEKYRRNKTGVFELIENIIVDDREVGEYIDTKIAYGATYRYRIKTILRWVHPKNVDVNGTINENSILEKFSQTKTLAGSNATFFDSDWSRNWEYVSVVDLVPPEPPDEILVRPVSRKKEIHISWKMPLDQQRDIAGFIVFRKMIDREGKFVSSWVQISDIYPPRNGLFVDTNVEFKEENGDVGYVYAVQTITAHHEQSTLSDQIAAWISEEAGQIGEMDTRFISEQGVSLMMHGQFSVKPIKKIEKEIIAKDIVSFIGKVGDSRTKFDDMTYTLRLTSLDTGERKEVELYVDYIDIPGYVREVPTVVLINTSRTPKKLTIDTTVVGPVKKDNGSILSKPIKAPTNR